MATGSGEALRALPLETGLSQAELAEAAGFHQAMVSSVEQESRTPGIDVLLNLCRVLCVSPNDIFAQAAVSEFALFQEGRRG